MKKSSRLGIYLDIPIKTSMNYDSVAHKILDQYDPDSLTTCKSKTSNLDKWKNLKKYRRGKEELDYMFDKLFKGDTIYG